MNPIKKCFKLSVQEGSLGNLSIRKLWSTTAWKAKPFWGIIARAVNIRFCGSDALPSSIGRSIIRFIVTERKNFFALLKKKKKKKQMARVTYKKMVTVAWSIFICHFWAFRLICKRYTININVGDVTSVYWSIFYVLGFHSVEQPYHKNKKSEQTPFILLVFEYNFSLNKCIHFGW